MENSANVWFECTKEFTCLQDLLYVYCDSQYMHFFHLLEIEVTYKLVQVPSL